MATENDDKVTFNTLSNLYEWALYYHIDFVLGAFDDYFQTSQLSINEHARCGERKTLHQFYKKLTQPIDSDTLKAFNKIRSEIFKEKKWSDHKDWDTFRRRITKMIALEVLKHHLRINSEGGIENLSLKDIKIAKVTSQNFNMDDYKQDINTLYSDHNAPSSFTDPDHQYFLNIIKLNGKTTKAKIVEIFEENNDRTIGKEVGNLIRGFEKQKFPKPLCEPIFIADHTKRVTSSSKLPLDRITADLPKEFNAENIYNDQRDNHHEEYVSSLSPPKVATSTQKKKTPPAPSPHKNVPQKSLVEFDVTKDKSEELGNVVSKLRSAKSALTQSNRAKDPLDNVLQKARAIEKNVTIDKETQMKNNVNDNNTRGLFRSRRSVSSPAGVVDLTIDKNDIDYPQTQTDDILDNDTDSDFGNTRNSNGKRKIRINEVTKRHSLKSLPDRHGDNLENTDDEIDSNDDISDNRKKVKRKARRYKWTAEEDAALLAGIEKYGVGQWANILSDPEYSDTLSLRTNVNLKDRFRNLQKSQHEEKEEEENND